MDELGDMAVQAALVGWLAPRLAPGDPVVRRGYEVGVGDEFREIGFVIGVEHVGERQTLHQPLERPAVGLRQLFAEVRRLALDLRSALAEAFALDDLVEFAPEGRRAGVTGAPQPHG